MEEAKAKSEFRHSYNAFNDDNGIRQGLVNLGFDNPIDCVDWVRRNKNRQYTGEEKLMIAVLEDGIVTATEPINEFRRAAKIKERDTARAWIARSDNWGTFSFASICEALDLAENAARRAIEGRYSKRAAPIKTSLTRELTPRLSHEQDRTK